MHTARRIVIVPHTKDIAVGVLWGMIFLAAAGVSAFFLKSGFNLLTALFVGLSILLIVNALASSRGPSSLPRVEIDQTGIRLRWLLHDERINWPTIKSVESHVRFLADGDDYSVNILYEQRESSNHAGKKCGRLSLNEFILQPDRDRGAASEIAAWLDELRTIAAGGRNALDGVQPPKYLRCLVIP